MASSVTECVVCMEEYNDGEHKPLILPCFHIACASCLSTLQDTNNKNCPLCKNSWAYTTVSNLKTVYQLIPDTKNIAKATNTSKPPATCRQHKHVYVYWCKTCLIPACQLCQAEIHKRTKCNIVELKDALSEIKSGGCQLTDNIHNKIDINLIAIKQIENGVLTKLQIVSSESEKDKQAAKEENETIATTENNDEALNSFCSLHDKFIRVCYQENLWKKKLFQMQNILDSTGEETSKLADYPTNVDHTKPKHLVPAHIIAAAAQEMRAGSEWLLDDQISASAAVQALAVRRPSVLSLVSRDDGPPLSVPSVADVAEAATGVRVTIKYLDSFYRPGLRTDALRLNCFLANTGILLTEFYGYLDANGIHALPHSIDKLGLAIPDDEASAAVSRLRVWPNLLYMHVAVLNIPLLEQLKPLPAVQHKCLHFYRLTDDTIDSVRAVIEALVPNKKLYWMFLPKCGLTVRGARQLARRLRGFKIPALTIDTRNVWRPEQRDSVDTEYRVSAGCTVYWGLYKTR